MTPPARLFALDGDGGFKAAIWGGAFSARQTCMYVFSRQSLFLFFARIHCFLGFIMEPNKCLRIRMYHSLSWINYVLKCIYREAWACHENQHRSSNSQQL